MRIAKALIEHGKGAMPNLQIATFDVSVNDLPHRFNASGVRVWANVNVPQEFSSLPMTGYHSWRYFHVPALFFFPPGDGSVREPLRYEGDLVYLKVKAFMTEALNKAGKGGKEEL